MQCPERNGMLTMAMLPSPGGGVYVAKPPPPPPPMGVSGGQTINGDARGARSATSMPSRVDVDGWGGYQQQRRQDGGQVLDVTVVVLRGAAALSAFVAAALVASCRHGDWMEFPRYQEYRYLLGVSAAASLYSAARAARGFLRLRRGGAAPAGFLDFAGDQAAAYLVATATAAAAPITIRMRSAVVNVFTDAVAASIVLDLIAFAALASSGALAARKLSRQTHH